MIDINKLNKKFGRVKVLEDVSLKIDKSGVFAILGPNGSGKTTLIKSILGMVIPQRGVIKINGDIISNQWLYRKSINYLPQIARLPDNLKVASLQ